MSVVLLQWLAALGGVTGLSALISTIVDRRTRHARAQVDAAKVRAEADKVEIDGAAALTDIALRMLEPLQAQVTHLTAEVHDLGQYIEVLIGTLRSSQIPVPGRPRPGSGQMRGEQRFL